MTTITTKRITAVPSGGNTARLAISDVQTNITYNTWGTSWGVASSWLISWRRSFSLSDMGHDARITATPSGGQAKRITAEAAGGQTKRIIAVASGGQTKRVTGI